MKRKIKNEEPWVSELFGQDIHQLPPEKDVTEGGPGSGNFGHAGRPGERGGSAPDGGVGGGEPTAPEWKPSMSPEEAEKWAGNSSIKDVCFHTTGEVSAEVIQSKGFVVGDGCAYGAGVYLSRSPEPIYGHTALQIKLNVENPVVYSKKLVDEAYEYSKKFPNEHWGAPSDGKHNNLTEYCKSKGYDCLLLPGFGTRMPSGDYADWLVVFDPKQVTIVGSKDSGKK